MRTNFLLLTLVSALAAALPAQGGDTRPARAPRLAADRLPLPPALAARYRFPTKGEEPRFELEALQRELGEVPDGPDVEVVFPFANRGKGPLVLLALRPHCGCLGPKIEVAGKPYELGDPIAPGAEGRVVIVLRTKGLLGEKDLETDLLSNDPALPEVPEAEIGFAKLRIKTKIIRALEWEGTGGAVDLGRFPVSRGAAKTVVLKSARGEPFEITAVEGGGAYVDVKAEAEDANKTRWRLVLTAKPNLPLGVFQRQLWVKTRGAGPLAAGPLAAGADLYVVGTPRGSVDVHPPNGLQFQVVLRGAAKSLTFSLIHDGKEPWKVGNWRLLDPASVAGKPESEWKPLEARLLEHFKIEAKETTPNQQFDLTVSIDASMPAGPFAAVLAVSTGLADGPATLTAPVAGVVR